MKHNQIYEILNLLIQHIIWVPIKSNTIKLWTKNKPFSSKYKSVNYSIHFFLNIVLLLLSIHVIHLLFIVVWHHHNFANRLVAKKNEEEKWKLHTN